MYAQNKSFALSHHFFDAKEADLIWKVGIQNVL